MSIWRSISKERVIQEAVSAGRAVIVKLKDFHVEDGSFLFVGMREVFREKIGNERASELKATLLERIKQ